MTKGETMRVLFFLLFMVPIAYSAERCDMNQIMNDLLKCCQKCEQEPESGQCGEKDVSDEGQIRALLNEINKMRKQAGAKSLSINVKLSCAAKKHSDDMGNKQFCSHTGSNGLSPWKRAETCNTRAYGEIIACGQRKPVSAVKAWMDSAGHKKIMLKPQFRTIGLGMYKHYWTAIFGY